MSSSILGGSQSGASGLGKEAGELSIAGGTKLFNESQPDVKAIMQQVYSILAGGSAMNGLGIPLAQQAVGGARAAGSQSMQGADAYLAQNGLQGSPFAAALQSMIGQNTQQQIGAAPTSVAESILGMFSQAPLQGATAGLTALNGAQQSFSTSQSSQTSPILGALSALFDPANVSGMFGNSSLASQLGLPTAGSVSGSGGAAAPGGGAAATTGAGFSFADIASLIGSTGELAAF